MVEALGDSARVDWTTNELANSAVRYGLDVSYGEVKTDPELVVEHSVWLAGLIVDTTYYYVVESTDAHGNGPTISAGGSFRTEPTAAQWTARGWTLFEAADYGGAQAAFEHAHSRDSLFADAWSGSGWAHLRGGEREAARLDFERCLSLDASHGDGGAGLAVALSALGEKDACADLCLSLLDTFGDSYEFEHDTTVNSVDLRILLAESYVHLLELELALEQVQVLDPGVELSPGDPETWDGHPSFAAALLAEIEALALSSGT